MMSKSQCYQTYLFFTEGGGNKLVCLSEARIILQVSHNAIKLISSLVMLAVIS
jgi:hypothetical protein